MGGVPWLCPGGRAGLSGTVALGLGWGGQQKAGAVPEADTALAWPTGLISGSPHRPSPASLGPVSGLTSHKAPGARGRRCPLCRRVPWCHGVGCLGGHRSTRAYPARAWLFSGPSGQGSSGAGSCPRPEPAIWRRLWRSRGGPGQGVGAARVWGACGPSSHPAVLVLQIKMLRAPTPRPVYFWGGGGAPHAHPSPAWLGEGPRHPSTGARQVTPTWWWRGKEEGRAGGREGAGRRSRGRGRAGTEGREPQGCRRG